MRTQPVEETGPEDQDLVEQAQAGSRSAFDALAERYRARMFGAAYGWLGNAQDAEDVTQEALTQAWRQLPGLREPHRFPGWLYRIVQNRCRNVVTRSRHGTVSIDQVEATLPSAGSETDGGVAAEVREAIDGLSEPYRLVTTLHYLEGYTVAEVSGLLGIPVGTVKRRLYDARCQLRHLGPGAQDTRKTTKKGTTMRIFSGRGDRGETDLIGGGRVGKDDPRVGVLGALDEAMSAIGLGRALAMSEPVKEALVDVQRDLYALMAGLAFVGEVRPAGYGLGDGCLQRLETTINDFSAHLEIARQFILPGDSAAGAALDLARTVARRAEREVVALAHAGQPSASEAVPYLNRLSSVLFVMARYEDNEAGVVPRRAKGAAS